MKKFNLLAVIGMLLIGSFLPAAVDAQRRARPGSMKHSQAEITEYKKVKNITCKYIRNGATFEGPIYMGGIKIGDGVFIFKNGKYKMSFDAAKFKIKKHASMTDQELSRKGISKYEYENAWEHKKLGEDFEYEGKFSTIEQSGQKWLILYQEDSDEIFAKISIGNINDKTFELRQEDIHMKMSFVK